MSITVKFQINSGKVILEIPHKNLHLEKPNTILYDLRSNCLVNVGKHRGEIETENKNTLENLCFASSFQYDDEVAGRFDIEVIEHYLDIIYYANQTLSSAIETIDFDFQIEKYHLWSEQRQLRFEYDLQTKLRTRHIKINNKNKETSIWNRSIEQILRLLLLTVTPLGSLYYISLKLSSAFQLPGLFISFLGVGLLFIINIAIWVFLTRRLLPASYNQFIFENLRPGSFAQKIVSFIISSERKK